MHTLLRTQTLPHFPRPEAFQAYRQAQQKESIKTMKTMLKDFKPRLYQEQIFASSTTANTLVVLPTGLGKTAIAIMLAAHRLKARPDSKIVMFAPTKPLAEQHMRSFLKRTHLSEEDVALFTGAISPEKRTKLYPSLKIIFATPQGFENDIISNRILLKDISLMIFDEAHRAVGEYAYVLIAKKYLEEADFPRILALTASPGSDIKKIEEVCQNCGIENVEVRTEEDVDVKPYVHEIETDWLYVDLPKEFQEAKKYLEHCFKDKCAKLKEIGYSLTPPITKRTLLETQRALIAKTRSNEMDPEDYQALSLTAEAIKVEHAVELFETQGVDVTESFYQKIEREAQLGKSKAAKNLSKDAQFKLAGYKIRELKEKDEDHPKFAILRDKVKAHISAQQKQDRSAETPLHTAKVIVFTQFRETAVKIANILNGEPEIKAEVFVGQQKKGDTGLSQKKQIAMLNEFKEGQFNVLVATSVAEEGLDIPQVDAVIFYEPIPSAIRHIQRRGRTGRQKEGAVTVLIAKGTRDEAYRWTAFHKEKRMRRYFNEIKTLIAPKFKRKAQATLASFQQTEQKVKIIADHREKSSHVLKELSMGGVELELQTLDVGDYRLSNRVAVEFKTAEDFVNSIIDGRLLGQLRSMRDRFPLPLLIIEGTRDLYSVRNIHPNSINGMLTTIAISLAIPILWTKNAKETAQLLMTIAKREQTTKDALPQLHNIKRTASIQDTQEYIIASLPSVGTSLARTLLKHFGTIERIAIASVDDLKAVEGVGEKKAKQIYEVLHARYG